MRYDKLILFDGGVETHEFFIEQMAGEFARLGFKIFIFSICDCQKSIKELRSFVCGDGAAAAAVTFNHTGIAGEDIIYSADKASNIWDELSISVYNIDVDHPYYYHDFLRDGIRPKNYHHISIDLNHMTYLKRFFPQITEHMFMPLGGTGLSKAFDEQKPFRARSNDIVFTGNYRKPEFFLKFIKDKGQEYIDFYMGIYEDLKANPERTLEDTAYEHIVRELGDIADSDLKDVYKNMIFLDLMIRFYYRGEVIKEIIDSGHKIRIYGAGWEELDCKCPHNITSHGFLTSLDCLKLIADSKVSVNVMPWFKKGAHDRIFNTMLNGAVCLTDSSQYLDEIIKDGKNAIYFNLKNISDIPERIDAVLTDNAYAERIAACGYETAAYSHTWAHRARQLAKYINS